MITIIHGDDLANSRNYFLNLKSKQKDSISLGENISITSLSQNIQGSGLFSSSKTLFIENLLSKSKKGKDFKEILTFITNNHKDSSFILWESKEITKRDLIKEADVKIFKLPKNIFAFLDSVKPNNSKLLISMFHKCLNEGISEELILFMLQRQFRMLLGLADPGKESIAEITRIAPWQRTKLEKQAKSFTLKELKRIFQKLQDIEKGQKTGSLSIPLNNTIDIFLLEI